MLAACTVLVIYYPRTIQSLDRRADENSSLSFQDRSIAGGNGVVAELGASDAVGRQLRHRIAGARECDEQGEAGDDQRR